MFSDGLSIVCESILTKRKIKETYAEQLLAYLMLAEISVNAAAAAAAGFFFCGAIFALRDNNEWPLNDFFSSTTMFCFISK